MEIVCRYCSITRERISIFFFFYTWDQGMGKEWDNLFCLFVIITVEDKVYCHVFVKR